MNRRTLTLMVALVPIIVFGVLLAAVTVPYVALGPGPTYDTLGEVDGKQVVAIEGTPVKPTSGQLNMTTVSQRDGLTLAQALALWASGSDQLIPRDLVFPPEKSRDDIKKSQDGLSALRGQRRLCRAELPEIPQGRHGGERQRPRPVGGQAAIR